MVATKLKYIFVLILSVLFIVSCAGVSDDSRKAAGDAFSLRNNVVDLFQSGKCPEKDTERLKEINNELVVLEGNFIDLVNKTTATQGTPMSQEEAKPLLDKHSKDLETLREEVTEIRKRCGEEKEKEKENENESSLVVKAPEEPAFGRTQIGTPGGFEIPGVFSGFTPEAPQAKEPSFAPVLTATIEHKKGPATPGDEAGPGGSGSGGGIIIEQGEAGQRTAVFGRGSQGGGGSGGGIIIGQGEPGQVSPPPAFPSETFRPDEQVSRQAVTGFLQPTHRVPFHRFDLGGDEVVTPSADQEEAPSRSGTPTFQERVNEELGLVERERAPLETQSHFQGICFVFVDGKCVERVAITNQQDLDTLLKRLGIPATFFSTPSAGGAPPTGGGKTDCGTIMSSFSGSGMFSFAAAAGEFPSAASCSMIASSSCANCVTIVVTSGGGSTSVSIFPQGMVSFSAISATMPPPGTPYVATFPATIHGVSGMVTVTVIDGSSITASVVFMPM